MSTEIVGVVNELKAISSELKKHRNETIKLNKRKKQLETIIIDYLQAKDEHGFKHNGIAIIAEEKEARGPKKKSEKIEGGISVLENYGIDNPKEVLEELIERMKGSPVPKTKLKIKEIKKK